MIKRLRRARQTARKILSLAFWTGIGLKTKMVIVSLAGLLALIGIFGFLSVMAAQEATNRALEERVVLAQVAASHADYVLDNAQALLESIAANPALRQSDAPVAARQRVLRDAVAQHALLRRLCLTDAAGNVLISQPSLSSDLALPAEILRGAPFGVASADLPGMGSTIVAAAPVRDDSGTLVGVLAAQLDLAGSGMETMARVVTLGQTGYLEIVDARGLTLLSTRPQRRMSRADQELAAMIRDGKSVVTTCYNCADSPSGADQQLQIIAFAPLRRAPWGIVIRQAAAEAFAAPKQLEGRIVLLGVLAVMGAVALVWLTTRSVIAPIENLKASAERIANGDLETPIGVKRGDEIGALAATLDDMRARLRASIGESQALNRDLDRRVQERTRELVNAQTALRRSRDYLQSIIDGLDDVLLVVGPDQIVQQANKAACQRLNRDAVGLRCYEVSHCPDPCAPPNCQCPLQTVIATNQTVRVTHLRPDGSGAARYVEVVASPLRDENGQTQAVIELMYDVTEERELRETLVQRNRELSLLNVVATAVTQPLHLNELLDRALTEVLRVTGVDAGSIFLLREDTRTLELRACLGTSDEAANAMMRLHLDDSACGGVVEKGQPMVVSDLRHYRSGAGRALRQAGLRALVHVPLVSHGVTLGTLCVGTRVPREFQQPEVDLLMAIGNQIAVGIENARLYDELARREQLRGELLEKVITAQEEERKRIARDLHDDTSQALSALIYSLEATKATCDDARVQSSLASMRQLVTQTLDGVHKLIFDLRPSMLDHLGLFVALRWYAETHLQPAGIRLRVEEKGALQRLAPQMETALFRVGQEALNNIVRHAGARNVHLVFDCQDSVLRIDIEDDGIGFDMKQVLRAADQPRGLGLVGMQERVGLLGGQIAIVSTPGHGTRVSIHAPLEKR